MMMLHVACERWDYEHMTTNMMCQRLLRDQKIQEKKTSVQQATPHTSFEVQLLQTSAPR